MFLVLNIPRLFILPKNPRATIFNPFAMSSSSSSSIKIIAEYAKSARSSCKKCSAKIDSKSLRLGLSSRDPRGFDNVKWHHLQCFFSLNSESVSSAESIEGFSELMCSDQEKLKQLVSEGGQPSMKLDGDMETEQKERTEKIEETDRDEEPEQEERKEKAEKVIAECAKSSRSSCKKCGEKIDSNSLRLALSSWDPRGFDDVKWHHLRCFFSLNPNLLSSAESIEGFLELKSTDQEKLKKLVSGGAHSSEESNEEESYQEKNEKIQKIDKDDKTKQEEKDLTAEKTMSSSIKIVYAKSGRSSCKKCAENIASKSLRLGFSSRDPRGFDNTKWHHVDCFFPSNSSLLSSAELIDGFSELKSSDQEKLKKLMSDGDEFCKKRKGVDADWDGRDLKKQKTSELLDNHSGLVVAFTASDIKDHYKGAKLRPKWKAFRTLIFLERDDSLQDSRKVAAFDFDGCLAKTSVKRVGADAWSLMYSSIPTKLQSLYSDGYKLVIFTNESNIERWKNKRQVAVDSKIGRLESFINLVKVPIQVFIACGVSKGQEEDPFRKPQPGMWHVMEQQFNSGIPIDMDQSFYVGDAAGRKDDHGDADKKFAEALGLKFYLPEEYFGC